MVPYLAIIYLSTIHAPIIKETSANLYFNTKNFNKLYFMKNNVPNKSILNQPTHTDTGDETLIKFGFPR